MTLKSKGKLNSKALAKSACGLFLGSVMLLSSSCGSENAVLSENVGLEYPSFMMQGVADSTIEIGFDNVEDDNFDADFGGEYKDVLFYIPSEETAGSDKVSTIKLPQSTANSVANQASYSTFLELKEQASSKPSKPSSGTGSNSGSSSGLQNGNVIVTIPSGKLNSIIKNGNYGTNKITVIQSGNSKLSEDTSDLLAAIKSNSRCDASFLAIRLSDGASIGYNVDKEWRCMSTFKAPTALYAYKLASDGKLNLSDKMTYTKSKYYYTGSGIIKSSASGTKYTLKNLISYSILHSDNSAYIMLRDYLSAEGISQMCKDMGCANYEAALQNWPKVSARDAALWWNEIYNFCSTDENYGDTLYTTFVNATGNMIDRALGYKYEVAHKSGSGSGYHHDCAIVMAEEPYILVLYTRNTAGGSSNYNYMSGIIREINEIMVG